MITADYVRATLTKQWDGNVIQNPNMVSNEFSYTDQSKDDAALTLRLVDSQRINDLKEYLSAYDFTNVSTNDLRNIGDRLYENGLIDDHVRGMLASGRGAFDINGHQTHMDEKFNAIALFYEDLQGTMESLSDDPTTCGDVLNISKKTNQVLNAMAYFSKSTRSDLSVRETA
ncbi:hypothetical protein DCO48_05260 [Pseudomonas sp. SDI]|uniref:hypothetical protein n=1 Tax=Pseudomonas sp. SDI TaxID=2170734 RepID=UPI000DE7885E|nr:hypothetical protein [Pseudomonas sp. SDI]PWB34554.1 hypothetical protein DCO48_05260 [Pseudomonas sp. SDI]